MSWSPPIVGGRSPGYRDRQAARVHNAIPVNASMIDFGRGSFRAAIGAVDDPPASTAPKERIALFVGGLLVGGLLGYFLRKKKR